MDIPALITRAHLHSKPERQAHPDEPGINDRVDLCWNCHNGLLHHDIITPEEVREAAAATLAGTLKVTPEERYRQIKADIDARHRVAKPHFDDRTAAERKEAAALAVQHRNAGR